MGDVEDRLMIEGGIFVGSTLTALGSGWYLKKKLPELRVKMENADSQAERERLKKEALKLAKYGGGLALGSSILSLISGGVAGIDTAVQLSKGEI